MATGSDELAPFKLENVEGLEAGEKKGRGAYGTVYKVTVNGVPCIAKRIHDILVNEDIVSLREKAAVQQTFRQECLILCKLRHPNIVHFIGVHYGKDQGDLSLVMECLHTDLGRCVETHPNIPLSIKLAILLDVSYGLLYLHTILPPDGPIIHRDLSAGNILLTADMRAKIADLGVSKLLNRRAQTAIAHTKAPGTPDYMPPEALKELPKYDSKLDLFSFGHLTLYTVNQEIPDVFEVTRIHAIADIQQGTYEIRRRRIALDKMGEEHCLYELTTRCLQDNPENRPSTQELNIAFKELCAKHPKTAEDLVQATGTQIMTMHQSEELRGEQQRLHDTLAATQKEKEALQNAVQVQEGELRKLQQQLKDKEEEADREKELLQQQIEDAVAQKEQIQEEAKLKGLGMKQMEDEVDRLRQFEQQVEELQAQLEEAQQRECTSESKLHNLEVQLQTLGYEKVAHERDQLQHHAKKQSEEVKELEQELEAAKAQVEAHDHVQHALSEANADKKFLTDRLERIAKERDQANQKCVQLIGIKENLEVQVSQVDGLQSEVTHTRAEAMKWREMMTKQQEEIKNLLEMTGNKHQEIGMLQESMEILTKENQELKGELEARKAQAVLWKHDFEEERREREKAAGKRDDEEAQKAVLWKQDFEAERHEGQAENKSKVEEKYEICQAELQQCRADLEYHQRQLRERQEQLDDMEKLFQAQQISHLETQNDMKAQQISHSETQKELKEARQTLEGALKGSSDLHDEVLAKTRLVDQYREELEKYKAKLNQMQRLAAQCQSQQAVGQENYDLLFQKYEQLQNLLKPLVIPHGEQPQGVVRLSKDPQQRQLGGGPPYPMRGPQQMQPQGVVRSSKDPQQRQLGGEPPYTVRGPQQMGIPPSPRAPQQPYQPTPRYQPVAPQYPHHPSPIYKDGSQSALQQQMQGDMPQTPQPFPSQHQQQEEAYWRHFRMKSHSVDDPHYLQHPGTNVAGGHYRLGQAQTKAPMHPPNIPEVPGSYGYPQGYEDPGRPAFHPLRYKTHSIDDPRHLQPTRAHPAGSGHIYPSQALLGSRTITPVSHVASQMPERSYPSPVQMSMQKPELALPPKPVHDEAHQQIVASQAEVFPSQPPNVQQQEVAGSSLELEIRQVAADVLENVEGKTVTGEHIPFDPNLVCPHCSQQFKAGQIQKFKRHVNSCKGT